MSTRYLNRAKRTLKDTSYDEVVAPTASRYSYYHQLLCQKTEQMLDPFPFLFILIIIIKII